MCEQLADIQHDLTSEISGFRKVNKPNVAIVVVVFMDGTKSSAIDRAADGVARPFQSVSAFRRSCRLTQQRLKIELCRTEKL
jgi:hypothetical protein